MILGFDGPTGFPTTAFHQRWNRESLLPALITFDLLRCPNSSLRTWSNWHMMLARWPKLGFGWNRPACSACSACACKPLHTGFDCEFECVWLFSHVWLWNLDKNKCRSASWTCLWVVFVFCSFVPSVQVDFGENYVQELLDKANELPNSIRQFWASRHVGCPWLPKFLVDHLNLTIWLFSWNCPDQSLETCILQIPQNWADGGMSWPLLVWLQSEKLQSGILRAMFEPSVCGCTHAKRG